ncbi:hypothetical protein chiPu_0021428 [Chiloscyllium punctatum]|uniref:Uncharacterized protein n=1 Tax=Chiloscyllium punctatum TaxID=137246 RepID=A0A401REZ7_CHIPU|nr:hypothetical protein [Chiloscyllium punctatum]
MQPGYMAEYCMESLSDEVCHWARCSLETGSSVVWRHGSVRRGDSVCCGQESGPGAAWRLGRLRSADMV